MYRIFKSFLGVNIYHPSSPKLTHKLEMQKIDVKTDHRCQILPILSLLRLWLGLRFSLRLLVSYKFHE